LSTKSAKLFLKDHVTLKTGVMVAENEALPSHENVLKRIKIEISCLKWNNISHYCSFWLHFISRCHWCNYIFKY